MSLRIIGGQFRNRLLKTPKGQKTRPTAAIVRKAVFDICQFQLEGAHFLDIFAGSGAMGFEALSRGAAHATFIDKDKHAICCIHENITAFNLKEQTTVLMGDALAMLKRVKGSFDIAYIDPPYGLNFTHGGAAARLLQELDLSPCIKPGGIIFVEEPFPPSLPLPLHSLTHKDSRKFGKSILHQYQKGSSSLDIFRNEK